MNISKFNNVLYKGNINNDFYLYCLKKNKKLIKYLFINIFFFIISVFISKKNLYTKNKYKYLKEIKNLDKEIKKFLNNNKKLNLNAFKKIDIVVDKIPIIFIKNLFKNEKVYGYILNNDFETDIIEYNKNINSINECDILYINNKYHFLNIKSKKTIIVKINNRRPDFSNNCINISCCVLLSLILVLISFLFNNKVLEFKLIFTYFSPLLFLLNFLPIFLFVILILLISKRIYISWGISSALVLILGIANQTMLTYRDDVIKFGDLSLLKEAAIMTNRYDLVIKKYTIIAILLCILIFFILKKYVNNLKIKKYKRLFGVALISLISILVYSKTYCDEKLYEKVGDKTFMNIWISTRHSQAKGLIYPFVYSIKDSIATKPKNYNEKRAKNTLSNYKYSNIPKNKKVNIIGIMLEAYNDFSKFDEIKFNKDIYKNFHEIQANSISGSLVTTIFGGGTVATERSFLTGFYNMPKLRKKTNSYVWYFKEQGYNAEAFHPITGAFYNRISVDSNLGFDYYYHYDNTFSKMQEDYLMDKDFFNFIEKKYEDNKKKDVPYFSFSVTYQNHGPYSGETYEGKKYYFDNTGYDLEDYNIINQYFAGIESTNEALKELVDYFDKDDSPVIIVFFGDHNPYLGNGYSTLGINLDLNDINGFENYYETPYVIHANDSAKKMFNKSFVGKGNVISPIFLMNELFNYIGLDGNEYMQYMSDLKKKTDVISKYYYKENNKFVPVNNSNLKKDIEEYESVNYYVGNNFKEKKRGKK